MTGRVTFEIGDLRDWQLGLPQHSQGIEYHVKHAAVGPIAVHFPDRVESNDDLRRVQPGWDLDEIEAKTGIRQRYLAAPDECASDLAVAAAEKLFAAHQIDRSSIDYLLFCTQTPDYALPTTACLMQQRLGLPTRMGALDFNLGCSGYVYGLSLAEGLIRSGAARRILFLTGETYTKLIHPDDRSLRTIFSDAATATLIEAADVPTLAGFQFGTDGSGANTLFADKGGFRAPGCGIQPRHRKRWQSDLYMDGASLMSFTVGAIPKLVQEVCEAAGVPRGEVRKLLFHQATFKMLDLLQQAIGVTSEELPIRLADVGNTVSSTLPILIDQLRRSGELERGAWNMLVGFGVGWSWAGCLWKDTLA